MATKREIDRFLSDPDFLMLVELQREQRLLFITDLTETRVSAFLAWLFRPQEGHGLGDRAIRELLLTVWRRCDEEELDIWAPEPRSINGWSFRDLIVRSEYQVAKSIGSGRGRSIDLLLVSRHHRLVVALENKFGSSVHSEQLKAYRVGIEKLFPKYRILLIYLDSNEGNSPDDDGWVTLDYGWLIELISKQQSSGLLSARALDALAQVKEYLNQDAAISDEDAARVSRLIEAVARNHESVIDAMRRFQQVNFQSLLETAALNSSEALLVEYCQRRKLWTKILDQARHVQLLAPIHEEFGDRLEVSVASAEVFFRMRTWSRFQQELDGLWVPRVSAWCGRDQRSTYDLWAVVSFKNVAPEKEEILRDVARMLRDAKLKAPPRHASWVLLSKVNQCNAHDAAALVIELIKKMDAELAGLP